MEPDDDDDDPADDDDAGEARADDVALEADALACRTGDVKATPPDEEEAGALPALADDAYTLVLALFCGRAGALSSSASSSLAGATTVRFDTD